MVVTRRAPVPPMPASRNHSTQQIPRVRGKAPSTLSDSPDVSSPLSNGAAEEESEARHDDQYATEQDTTNFPSKKKSSKVKSKSKHKKGGKKSSGGSTLLELLARVIILWFTIYSLSVCPQDTQLQSPICRGLSEYRRLVIDPYVLPPIRLALAHPSVAPYIQKAKPYKDRAVATAKPIAQRTLREWNARVVPQWDKVIVPLWNQRVVPQLQRLDAQVAPYRARVTHEYEWRIGSYVRQVNPYVEKVAGTLHQWQHKSRPYVVLAAHKTYDGYQRAVPYARPVGEKMKVLLARLVVFLAEKRRQFVDPHVQMLWERVKELSSGRPRVPAAAEMRDSITSHISKATEGAASVASSLIHAQTQSLDSLLPSDAGATTDVPAIPDVLSGSAPHLSTVRSTSPTSFSNSAAEQVASVASDISNVAHDTASSILDAAMVPLSSGASSVSSLAETALPSASLAHSFGTAASESATETLSSGSSIVSSVTDHLSSSASSLSDAATAALSHAQQSIVSSARHAPSALSSGMSSVTDQVAASVTPVVASPSAPLYQEEEDPDIDLNAFYAELGLQEVISESSAPTAGSVSHPPVKGESEEEKAERKRIRDAKMAEKRADITSRHAKWEQDLAESIEFNKKALRQALVALRKAAAAELKESTEIRAEVEGLVEEAEKFLRGAEKYLQTLSKEGRTEQEKRAMWERVTDKVDEKFAERLSQTEAVVNGWYMPVLDKELTEVRKVTDAVRDIADRAQTDIGMDYAYLDDVTYGDWQRYHDLLRRSDNFTNVANSIQNGSDRSPPINPVLDEILDLQAEVQDVVVGFETRLRRIKRNGERILGDSGQQTEPEPQQDDESVSILPIEDEGETQSPADMDIPPVVIGRSKEEVMDALNRLVEQDGQATSAPKATEQPSDPEMVVRSLTEEEDSSHTESSLIHEEL